MRPRKKILLVEDNPATEQALRQDLDAIDGLEIVHAARSAEAASQWLTGEGADWDLAVVDIFLRQGNGFEVLRRCKGLDASKRVVILSNYTREPVRSSAAAMGVDAVFDKSFELEEFIDYCRRFGQLDDAAGGLASPC